MELKVYKKMVEHLKPIVMANPEVTFITASLIVLKLTLLLKPTYTKKNKRHKRNVKHSNKVLNKLQHIERPQYQLGYLRKVDPYIFEELILSAFSAAGYKIKRNNKYSGDGGIDGKVIVNGQVILIQAKRYSSYINGSHVEDFSHVCAKEGAVGLFIHTGKTTPHSRNQHQGNIQLVGGDKLLKLLTEREFDFKGLGLGI